MYILEARFGFRGKKREQKNRSCLCEIFYAITRSKCVTQTGHKDTHKFCMKYFLRIKVTTMATMQNLNVNCVTYYREL
jgi:hypothetical protein